MNQQSQSLSPARSRKCAVYRMVLAAMFACLAFVLNTFVYFPAMAPFQHFIDVIAAVTLGPWYACAAAFICGILRMLSGRTVQAVTGAVFGPILGGLLYRRFHSLWAAALGEVIGTGFFGAIASYPLMKWFYGLDAGSPYYYIPFYTPSAVMGAAMGVAVLLILRRAGVFSRMLQELNQ